MRLPQNDKKDAFTDLGNLINNPPPSNSGGGSPAASQPSQYVTTPDGEAVRLALAREIAEKITDLVQKHLRHK